MFSSDMAALLSGHLEMLTDEPSHHGSQDPFSYSLGAHGLAAQRLAFSGTVKSFIRVTRVRLITYTAHAMSRLVARL